MKTRIVMFLTIIGMGIFMICCGEKKNEDMMADTSEDRNMGQNNNIENGSNAEEDNNVDIENNTGEGNTTGKDSDTGEGSNTAEGNTTGKDSDTGEGSNTAEHDNTGEVNNIGNNNSTGNNNGTENSNDIEPSEDDVDKRAEANQNAVANAGYYKIVSSSDGGYMVMVHRGEYSYGIQLLREYLANMGCHAPNGMGGGWINPDLDQYMCYVRGAAIVPLVTEDDE